jgi:hypothetical protein
MNGLRHTNMAGSLFATVAAALRVVMQHWTAITVQFCAAPQLGIANPARIEVRLRRHRGSLQGASFDVWRPSWQLNCERSPETRMGLA